MGKDLNKCAFIGRLGQDVEMRYTQSGTAKATISLACGDDYKNKDTGQKVEKTEWVRVVAFNRLAEIIGEFLTKGSQVYIEGKFTTRKWTDQSGQDKYTTEIVASEMQMLGGQSSGGQQPAGQYQGGYGGAQQGNAQPQQQGGYQQQVGQQARQPQGAPPQNLPQGVHNHNQQHGQPQQQGAPQQAGNGYAQSPNQNVNAQQTAAYPSNAHNQAPQQPAPPNDAGAFDDDIPF